MSRSYRRRNSRYKNKADSDATFVIVLLLACGVWAHRAFMLKVEHYAIAMCIATIGVVGFVALYRFFRIKRLWSNRHNHDMDNVKCMTGLEFERYVAQLLKSQGYSNIHLTEKYDYGVDIIATKYGITWGIQVKRYSGLVKADAIRQVVTALKMYHCDQAMVITNSIFSRPAQTLANSNSCILVDRSGLSRWINQTF